MTSAIKTRAAFAPITSSMAELPRNLFTRFQAIIHREAGIWLSDAKTALVSCRLSKRVRELGLDSMEPYCDLIETSAEERALMLDLITTNETHFFRDIRQFEFIEKTLVPAWKREAAQAQRSTRVRLWSAGCSSGEEPFTLSMILTDHLPQSEGWQTSILATDISSRVLSKAQSAVWPLTRAADIPAHYLKRHMLRGTGAQQDFMRAKDEIRTPIQFRRLNLNSEYSLGVKFDIIFCRNVLIYFNGESKPKAVRRLVSHLAPGGLLFLGHAENLMGLGLQGQSVFPNVYRFTEATRDPHAD